MINVLWSRKIWMEKSLGNYLDGEIVGEFLSIAHASRSLKISRRSLSCALSGAQKTAGGYIWEEKMEDDMQVQEQ